MPRIFLFLILPLLLATGACSKIRTGATAPAALPDYPRVASTMTPGQTMIYRDTSINLVDILREEQDPRILFTITRGRETTNFSTPLGERTVTGELLIHFQPRAGADPDDDLIVLNLFHLPRLMRAHIPRAPREFTESRPGEIAFFQDGFAAINAIAENDYVATDDDSVLLTIWSPGETMEDINLREFSSFPIGESRLRVGNVYGGDQPGRGRAELSVVPRTQAWEDVREREELLIPYRGNIEWRGHTLRAESIPGGWRTRILLTVQRGERSHDVVMTEGQAWRHGNVAWRFDGVTGSAARITALEYDRSIYPEDVRDADAVVVQRQQNPRAPTEVSRSLVTDQTIEFWGARIRLARVLEMDPTNLFDDIAELVFDIDGRLETVRVREGDRASIRGDNRWYVVQVTAATPSAPNRRGRAEIILTTGTFYNP